MSKRERDLKRKLQEEQQAAAYVYQDFIDTFHNPSSVSKTFVRCGTLYADKEENENVVKVYNPKPLIKQQKIDTKTTAIECAKILRDPVLDKSVRKQEKPKSNLDILKEELKQKHSERSEKERLKEEHDWDSSLNCYSEGVDPNTTNLFVANLRSTVTENHLMLEFGAYGPLASVKIMWPRADEKSRVSNCGFVAFMSRKDAERALKENNHRDDIRLGWGKPVEIPMHPIYIPGELLKYYLPPPQTDLPFSAQPPTKIDPSDQDIADILPDCKIKVTIPLNKRVLALVHRVVEFVLREGPVFEAFIMNKEIRNPDFNFLFDCKSPVHVYYRWKLFSILNGDGQKSWSQKKFRMFTGGSVWIPPTPVNFTEGMPEELVRTSRASQQNTLSDSQCTRLVNLLRNLTPHRKQVSEVMVFCLNHKNAIDDAIAVVLDSMMGPQTDALKKIARLYLLSDILHNGKSKRLRTKLEEDFAGLVEAFKALQQSWQRMRTDFDRDCFKSRVARVLKHWETYKILPVEFFEKVDEVFASAKSESQSLEDDGSSVDEPLDGARLLKRSMEKEGGSKVETIEEFDMSGITRRGTEMRLEYFVPSKWDAVDPEEIEAHAMSTEKLYYMELESRAKEGDRKTRKKKKKTRFE